MLTNIFETVTSLKMAAFTPHFSMHIIYYLHIFDFSYSRPKKIDRQCLCKTLVGGEIKV